MNKTLPRKSKLIYYQICAWCGANISKYHKPGSHGMCDKCLEFFKNPEYYFDKIAMKFKKKPKVSCS